MLSEDSLLERTFKDGAAEADPAEGPVSSLNPRYMEIGFSLTSFAGHSTMLWHEDELVFIFGSTIPATPEMVSKICDCFLKCYGPKEMV
jgi:hypothetical protein